jgi:hypothetical protein
MRLPVPPLRMPELQDGAGVEPAYVSTSVFKTGAVNLLSHPEPAGQTRTDISRSDARKLPFVLPPEAVDDET